MLSRSRSAVASVARRHPAVGSGLGCRRSLRATPPKEVGPLIAGIGVAVMAYGAKLLMEAARSGQAQEAMQRAAESVRAGAAAASSAASSATTSARRRTASSAAASEEEQRHGSPIDSYFTTDVMGVDLGQGAKAWSGACAAIVERGDARVVENAQGQRATPSMVAFTDGGELLVGQPAKKLLFARGATPIAVHTQLLGLAHDSDVLRQLLHAGLLGALDVVADGSDSADARAVFRVHGVHHRPEELTARVLGSLKDAAESALGNRKILSAVAGAPVLATDATREAIVAAGRRAGLSHIDLIDVPVAGACAAADELPQLGGARKIGVYDLGGASFSFSVLERTDGGAHGLGEVGDVGWRVLGASRRPLLGGEGFDVAIVDHLVSSFRQEHSIDLSVDHLALQRLHEAAETAKLELSTAHQAAISLPFITADASGPKHLEMSLGRARFHTLIEPLLLQSTPACEEALANAGVGKGALDAVLLIGGSARVEAVAEHAASVLGAPTLRMARPEEAVALGAATVAQGLQEREFSQYQ